MIQHSYGWTDDQVLDLTVGRIAQCVRRISDREYLKFRREATLLQNATRYISAFGAMSGEVAMEALKIQIFDMSDGDDFTTETQPPIIRSVGISDEVIDESERKVTPDVDPAEKNSAGTFEKIMGSMGRTSGSG